MRLFSLFSFLLFPFSYFSFSQSNQNLSLVREKNILYERYLNGSDSKVHTSIKPFNNSKELEAINDSIKKNMMSATNQEKKSSPNELTRTNKISVDGIFSCEFNYEKGNISAKNLERTAGLALNGYIKKKLSVNTTFLSGNSSFPAYLDTFIYKTKVIPGTGSAYGSNGKYSYQYYSGYLSYSPGKIFNFQIGKDKHFWGDGYRSLFLSDVSNSFPFAKISTTIWKLQYVNLFAMMNDVTASPFKSDIKKKYGTFHYLSWNTSKRFNLALFESIIWQGTDSNRVRKFDVNYLNPVIFYRPVEYSMGSSDNVLLGTSFKIKVGKKYLQQFYGQIILDEFLLKEVLAVFKKIKHPFDKTIQYGWWGNKQGVQLGFRSFDLFTLKNLTFQTEINAVRPYTYSHGSVQQNYGNYNQPLAHPLGSNFTESVSFLNYRYRKWMLETEFLYATYGKDENGVNYGGNIFESYFTHPMEYGNKFWQGLKTNLSYSRLKLAYYIIPSDNLLVEAGVAVRKEKNSISTLNSNYFFIGIRRGIMNRYADF